MTIEITVGESVATQAYFLSLQQRLAPTAGGLGVAQQGIKLGAFHALAFFAGLGLGDHLRQRHHIAEAVGHPRFRRQSVTPGAAGLLVVALHALGQVQVRHETHVGLVDAHAEGDGGHHHHPFLAQEALLVGGARGRVHAGVVGQCGKALFGQKGRRLVHALARQAVDDAGLTAASAQKVGQLAARVVLLHHAVADIGPVKARNDHARHGNTKLRQYVAARVRVCRRRERKARHIRKLVHQRREHPVIRPEIMPPFRHAMRLINGEERNPCLPQQVTELHARCTFRCDIEQVKQPGAEPLDRFGAVLIRRSERRRADACGVGCTHLIVHQRNQRRDDDGGAFKHHRGQLIAKRLAGTRGHDRERPLARHHPVNDLRLHATKSLKAKGGFESDRKGLCG